MHSHLKDLWIKELRALPRERQAPAETEVITETAMAPEDLIIGHVTPGAKYDPLAILGLLYERSTGKRVFKQRSGNAREFFLCDRRRAVAQWVGLPKGLDGSPIIVAAVEAHDLGHDFQQIADILVKEGAR